MIVWKLTWPFSLTLKPHRRYARKNLTKRINFRFEAMIYIGLYDLCWLVYFIIFNLFFDLMKILESHGKFIICLAKRAARRQKKLLLNRDRLIIVSCCSIWCQIYILINIRNFITIFYWLGTVFTQTLRVDLDRRLQIFHEIKIRLIFCYYIMVNNMKYWQQRGIVMLLYPVLLFYICF